MKQSMKHETNKNSGFCLLSAQYVSTLAWILDEKHESVVPFEGFSSWVLFIGSPSPYNEGYHFIIYILTTCTI